ncbi:hypothetical protein [Paenibacillus radicis (ex Gao et al. 2016)]|uniref:Uncharacterized protein n=1 Tax=Paenibacillus radicis (ex Gao et al. 2016) TaxID=1737354 RepID=A0A917HAU2_9BACL|nr:hypothetical protein [Paenibacillus radicis (ex Gao et al. 2016)]GGG73332.1 hypothetical protein GCM10010918_31740 [Paenibacillus radicis (ex Gao et al. 2016)]
MEARFEIKYEIFEDDVAEIETIDVNTFDIDFQEIYGIFTLVIDGQDLIPYPPLDVPLSAKRSFSELILTHFGLLIDVYHCLKSHDYAALKYIEDSSTWLEIKVEGEQYRLSELNYDLSPRGSFIHTNQEQFKEAKKESIIDVCISKYEFENELKRKLKRFIRDIEKINMSLLESRCFSKVLKFYQDHN